MDVRARIFNSRRYYSGRVRNARFQNGRQIRNSFRFATKMVLASPGGGHYRLKDKSSRLVLIESLGSPNYQRKTRQFRSYPPLLVAMKSGMGVLQICCRLSLSLPNILPNGRCTEETGHCLHIRDFCDIRSKVSAVGLRASERACMKATTRNYYEH
eukprot:IDg22858t1